MTKNLHSTLVRFYALFFFHLLFWQLHLHSTLVRFYGSYNEFIKSKHADLHSTLVRFYGCILLKRCPHNLIYIPHWLDSMKEQAKELIEEIGFTFHTG